MPISIYMPINAQSIYNKFYEFQAQVHQIQPKIIAITESWCNNLISDTEIQLDGYNMYRHDRNTTSGGGVLLHINQSLLSTPCTALNEQGYQEATWCTITLNNNDKLLVGVIYRSPYSSPENTDKLIRTLQNLHRYVKFTDVLLMGDFNFPHINWDALCVCDGASSMTQLFLDAVQDAF